MGSLSGLPPLTERQTASDYVADVLREAIVTGQFEDGRELNQVELAKHFNVSRVPVREALRRLEAEGLVSAEAHRRAVVTAFNRDRISEIFEIRAQLETYMLERAAKEIDADTIEALKRLCNRMDRLKDHRRWLEQNHAFHRALLEPSGASTSLALVDQLSGHVQRYVMPKGGVHRPEQAGREHRQIVAALERGDIAKAKDVLGGHILRTRDEVIASLPEESASAGDEEPAEVPA